MSLKGYPTSDRKIDGLSVTESVQMEHVTVQPTGSKRYAMDTVSKNAFRVDLVADTAETGSTSSIIKATGHSAKVGDYLRWESGSNQYIESPVIKVTTDYIYLGGSLPVDPLNTDTFYVMRYVTTRTDETGAQTVISSPGPTQFVKDSVDVEVTEDTSTPANNKPLPTKSFGLSSVDKISHDYSSTSVENTTYVQIKASTSGRSDFITLFDGGGYAMILAFGAAASEVDKLYIPPGGFNGVIPFYIPAGTRLSIKSISGLANAGQLIMNTLE